MSQPSQHKKLNVALLKGGWSVEREVSLSSARVIKEALDALGHRVIEIDVTRDVQRLLDQLTPKPDVVFNGLHGRWGEDGCIQGVLELLDIPYTHSGVLASAMAMYKPFTRDICEKAGMLVPKGQIMTRAECMKNLSKMPRPFVIKPLNEGSSVGVLIVREGDVIDCDAMGDHVLVEDYINGREVTVAVLNGKAIGAIEVCHDNGFLDYEAKYSAGKAKHLMPAPIHPKAYEEALRLAEKAHQLLGCRGVSRSDFVYDDTKGEPGTLYFLELNSQPGMTPTSFVPDIVRHFDITMPTFVQWLIEDASCPR